MAKAATAEEVEVKLSRMTAAEAFAHLCGKAGLDVQPYLKRGVPKASVHCDGQNDVAEVFRATPGIKVNWDDVEDGYVVYPV